MKQKTFQNPLKSGFYPDPSICRVGDDYYMVTSSSIAGIFLIESETGYASYYSYNILGGSTAVPAGWLVPWDYIYNKAHVKLIVPSDMGTQNAMSSVVPYYYDIRYQIY